VHSTRNLIKKENTVVAIEHNNKYISKADYKIELGPEGGPGGGYLISAGAENNAQSLILKFKKVLAVFLSRLSASAVTKVDFPEPETPVMHVIPPIGNIAFCFEKVDQEADI